MRIGLLFFCLFGFLSFSSQDQELSFKLKSIQAYEYLQKVRSVRSFRVKEFPFLSKAQVSNVSLKWNDTLYQVAKAKIEDMVKGKYFAHVDKKGFGINHYIHKAGYELDQNFLKTKNQNNFESIAFSLDKTASSIDLIKQLIIDKGVPSLGHRKHLLGLDEFYKTLYDIGIAYAEFPNKEYPTLVNAYLVVIIAKHF